jgi:hypothetical protein
MLNKFFLIADHSELLLFEIQVNRLNFGSARF